jgi:hypothetical protein
VVPPGPEPRWAQGELLQAPWLGGQWSPSQRSGAAAHRLDDVRCEVLDVHAALWRLLEVELVLRVLRKQVAHVLIVNLEVRRTHKKLGVLAAARRDHLEDLREGAWDDAAQVGRVVHAFHREGLARA